VKQHRPLGYLDYLFIALWFVFFCVETIADQQQWSFQTTKHQIVASKSPLTGEFKDGFIQSGVWAHSRHPNYFAEFSMWWAYWALTYNCIGFSWLMLGPVLYTILFHFSADFTESLQLLKYPAYPRYQQEVNRLIPWFVSK